MEAAEMPSRLEMDGARHADHRPRFEHDPRVPVQFQGEEVSVGIIPGVQPYLARFPAGPGGQLGHFGQPGGVAGERERHSNRKRVRLASPGAYCCTQFIRATSGRSAVTTTSMDFPPGPAASLPGVSARPIWAGGRWVARAAST